jgi:hypothetical protein
MPGGAECSCGKVFRYPPKYGMDSVRMTNMALGNARRHADAKNKKEQAGG